MGGKTNAVPEVSRIWRLGVGALADSARFSGTESSVQDNVSSARAVARNFQCHNFEAAQSESEMESLWSARKQALWASLAVRPEGTEIWSTDVAVPISRMAEIIGMTAKYSD